MRVLLDTNIVLDVLLNREPWVTEAAAVWQANDDGRLVGYVVASAITDIYAGFDTWGTAGPAWLTRWK